MVAYSLRESHVGEQNLKNYYEYVLHVCPVFIVYTNVCVMCVYSLQICLCTLLGNPGKIKMFILTFDIAYAIRVQQGSKHIETLMIISNKLCHIGQLKQAIECILVFKCYVKIYIL